MTKTCTKCRETKSLDCFSPDRKGRLGVHSQCKPCKSLAQQKRYNPDKQKKWNQARTPRQRRDSLLRYHYGITVEEFDLLFDKQNQVCAICGGDKPYNRGYWGVDHDHATGQVRGILCANCNVGLGCFKDNQEWLTAAIEYLKRTTP